MRPDGGARSPRRWWLILGLTLAVVMVFSILMGNRLSALRQDVLLGESSVGQWLEFDDFGLRVRVDEVEVLDRMAGSYDDSISEDAPNGLVFVRVELTVQSKEKDGNFPSCTIELRNAADEQVEQEAYGVAGPESTSCTYDEDDPVKEIPGGIEFISQIVFIAAPAPVGDFDILVYPQLDRYVRVTVE